MKVLGLAPIGAVALALTACGGGGSGVLSLDPVAKAADKTANVQSVHTSMQMAETIPSAGTVHMSAEGDSDNATHTAHMTMDMSDFARLAGTQGGDPAQWRGEAVVDGRNGGFVMYMRMPFLARALHTSKPWVKFDLQKLGKSQGLNIGAMLRQFGSGDPTQSLQLLRSVGNVHEAGKQQVGGTQTTEYDGTIDVAKMSAKLRSSGFGKIARQAHLRKIPVQVWIGADGLVRRLHESYTMQLAGAGGVKMDMTMQFSNFGEPVHVDIPAASDTVDVSSLIAKAQGQGSG